MELHEAVTHRMAYGMASGRCDGMATWESTQMAAISTGPEMAERVIANLRASGDDDAIPADGSLQRWVIGAWEPDDEDAQDVPHWVSCWLEMRQE
jgi:hypothetical protein